MPILFGDDYFFFFSHFLTIPLPLSSIIARMPKAIATVAFSAPKPV